MLYFRRYKSANLHIVTTSRWCRSFAMTMFQQSYNASARMLQAAKEMTDTLMGII